jgi:hypothetical protein
MNLIEVMSSNDIIIYDYKTKRIENGKEKDVYSIFISGTTDKIIENLESWMGDKIKIFTDATMPPYNFDKFKYPVQNVYYGDPVNTNSTLLLALYPGLQRFGSIKWNKDEKYRNSIITILKKIIDTREIDDLVIWCPNISIYESLYSILKELYPLSNIEKEGYLVITYYNSTLTRGVECDRREHIFLGIAVKPNGSFNHVAYMQRDHHSPFLEHTDQELKIILKEWATLHSFNGYNIYMPTPPEIKDYFESYADAIQKEKTFADTWQAVSRAKDPEGKKRSIAYCIGWNYDDVFNLIKWGSNVKYLGGDRIALDQGTLIPPPQALVTNSFEDFTSWMNDGHLLPEYVGFGIDLLAGIMHMLYKCR